MQDRTFFTSCFQLGGSVISSVSTLAVSNMSLGFLPEAVFLERLETEKESIGVFLLLGILRVSARFTKCLADMYGHATEVTSHFINRASELIPNEIYKPNVERAEGLFWLGMSEWE